MGGCCCTTMTGLTGGGREAGAAGSWGRGGAGGCTGGAVVAGTGTPTRDGGIFGPGPLDTGSGGSGGCCSFGIAGPIFSFSSSCLQMLDFREFVNAKLCMMCQFIEH